MEFLGAQIVSAVDNSSLAAEVFRLNHTCPMIESSICDPSTVHQMFDFQSIKGVQPMLTAGFPCQPLSRQGHQLRETDVRSAVLPGILDAAFLLSSSGLFLECVPEALTDPFTQKLLHDFAGMTNSKIVQRVVPLHTFWPSRRTRWFALIIPSSFGVVDFPVLPVLPVPPTVEDLIPAGCWPQWSQDEELQLKWNPLELMVYKDETYGSTDRQVKMSQPLATALHSWGNALTACPCLCRTAGLSPGFLKSKGLRGIEIKAKTWPHESRHIHPRELQILLGYPPRQECHTDCRAQLCLFGNSVSPIQVLWIYAHLLQSLGLSSLEQCPRAILQRYVDCILLQQDLLWPMPSVGVGKLQLHFEDTVVELSFHSQQTVRDLLIAESTWKSAECQMDLYCDGYQLPSWAFLQERSYHLVCTVKPCPFQIHPVLVMLDFLGVTVALLVPSIFTCHMVVSKAGISSYDSLVDASCQSLEPSSLVHHGLCITVRLDPELVPIGIALKLEGFGSSTGTLQFTEPHLMTGLWNFDQQIKNHTLPTWAGLGFPNLAIWLPSFSAAIFEFWPGVLQDDLVDWLTAPRTTIFALVHEIWGWSLVKFQTDEHDLCIQKFGIIGAPDVVTDFLVQRVQHASGRRHHTVMHTQPSADFDGSLLAVLTLLDEALGLPGYVVRALHSVRLAQDPRSHGAGDDALCSPTLPWTHTSSQLPVTSGPTLRGLARLGLHARFLAQFAKAWVRHEPITISEAQIKVLCLASEASNLHEVKFAVFEASHEPLSIFMLADNHWTFLHCYTEGTCLHVVHHDGLQSTPLSYLAPVVECLKAAWNCSQVNVRSVRIFSQRLRDSCGTVALAHFGYSVGLLSFSQAMNLEKHHSSLAVVSGLLFPHDSQGFGVDDQVIVQALEQILPAKGVALADVPGRAAAAIKAFGTSPISKALGAKNVWASLKQLGNSRPRPFMWVTHAELQTHIQEKAQSKFGADLDMRPPKGQKSKIRNNRAPVQIDPNSLSIPAGVFVNNSGDVLQQLQISEVQKDAQGVAFATFEQAKPFLDDAKLISGEALALFVVGKFPEDQMHALPTHSIRVPAIYKGTNEAALVDSVSIQLGDQAVFQKQNPNAPELATFPTVVFRAHIFRDLWESESEWKELIQRPVKTIVHTFSILRMCQISDCAGSGSCGFYHPSIEETGVESGLVDVWGIHWNSLDGPKQSPEKAAVLSMYLRIPESSFNTLHNSSGFHGAFFEPRCSDAPGPDANYAVVWLPQSTLKEVMHKIRTEDECLAACRIGSKYGVRCMAKHHEEVHATLLPAKPFIACAVTAIFRVEPLPIGTQ